MEEDPTIDATPEPEPSLPLEPIASQERIAAIDVLRGIAVLGIFLINMPLFVAPADAFFNWPANILWSSTADRVVTLFINIFAQGKFYTLFSFLFGLGFGVQLTRAQARNNPNFPATFRHRLTILLAIGLVHFFLIWWGDVLHVYALLGFLLPLFSQRSDETLRKWVLGLLLIPLTLGIVITGIETYRESRKPAAEIEQKRKEAKQKSAANLKKELDVYSKGSPVAILKHRFFYNLRQMKGEFFWGLELLTNFLIGLWVSRTRILQSPRDYLPLLRKLAWIALPIGLIWTAGQQLYAFFYYQPEIKPPLWLMWIGIGKEIIARPAIAFGYAAVLLLMGIRPWMSGFAAVGRMALTNYLLHSLVFTTVANSYGLGLYGQVPPTTQILLCFGFYALQIPFSIWWLKTHPYGPVEWVWRNWTYGVRPPWNSNITSASPDRHPH